MEAHPGEGEGGREGRGGSQEVVRHSCSRCCEAGDGDGPRDGRGEEGRPGEGPRACKEGKRTRRRPRRATEARVHPCAPGIRTRGTGREIRLPACAIAREVEGTGG